jgi:ATP-binding cassette subfamily B protein
LTIGLAALVLVRGLIPAALALAARGLINAAVGSLQAGVGHFEALLPWLLLGFFLAVIEGLTLPTNTYLFNRLSDEINLSVTSDILRHATVLDVASLEDPKVQDTLDRAQHDTAGAFSTIVANLQAVLSDAIQIVFTAAIITYLEPLVLLVICPLAAPYLLYRWRLAKSRYAEEVLWTTKRRWTRYFISQLTHHQAAMETKLLGLGPLFLKKFRQFMTEFRDRDRKRYGRDFFSSAGFATLTTACFYILFGRVALQVIRGGLTVGDIALFAAVASRLRVTLEHLINTLSSAIQQALHLENVRAFLQTAPEISDAGALDPGERRGEVELRNVSFTYAGNTVPAVADITLRIKPGEVVALVGENGAGKTTLVKLLARIYDPDAGVVRFDGLDLRDWPLDKLHASIAFLTQGFARYEATAGDNIAYGDWQRILERQGEIEAIARRAGVDETIERMPRGYQTMLGRMFGEVDLSGGQWQKLAVARALARNAALLILDEPTAHLDARAEYELFCRFRDLAKGRTTILVSHRFTTLGLADRIVVLDHGRIVESGTRDELLARGGAFASLYEMYCQQISFTARD